MVESTAENKLMSMSMSDRIDSNTVKAFQSYSGGLVGTANMFYREYVPAFPTYTWRSRDTFADAFKIVSMMIEKDYLKNVTLKKFIQIVKEVEAEL